MTSSFLTPTFSATPTTQMPYSSSATQIKTGSVPNVKSFMPSTISADGTVVPVKNINLTLSQIAVILKAFQIKDFNDSIVNLVSDKAGEAFKGYLAQLVSYWSTEAELKRVAHFSSILALLPQPRREQMLLDEDMKEISFATVRAELHIGSANKSNALPGEFPLSFFQRMGLYGAAHLSLKMKGNSFYHYYVKDVFQDDQKAEWGLFCSPLMFQLLWKKEYRANVRNVAVNFTQKVVRLYQGKYDPNKNIRDWTKLVDRADQNVFDSKFLTSIFTNDPKFAPYFEEVKEFNTENTTRNPVSKKPTKSPAPKDDPPAASQQFGEQKDQ